MISCIIIDDEPFARKLLADYINKVSYLHLKASFSDGLEALDILNQKQIDLIFLDIQMPNISGVDFLKALKSKPHVIFTTAHAEFALEGYELNVLDYLLKPFDFGRFLKSVDKASSLIYQKSNSRHNNDSVKDYIFIKDGRKLVKVEYSEIVYIKGLKDYIKLITTKDQVISLQTLKELVLSLPADKFARVHNSYIVSIDHISSIVDNKVKISDQSIPIGSTYKKHFLEKLNKLGI